MQMTSKSNKYEGSKGNTYPKLILNTSKLKLQQLKAYANMAAEDSDEFSEWQGFQPHLLSAQWVWPIIKQILLYVTTYIIDGTNVWFDAIMEMFGDPYLVLAKMTYATVLIIDYALRQCYAMVCTPLRLINVHISLWLQSWVMITMRLSVTITWNHLLTMIWN